jgi:predicted Zn-dependent peptidase
MSLARGNSVAVASARCWEGVDPEALEAAMIEAWQEFVDEGPTVEEQGRAQAQFAREWLTELAAVDQRADRLGQAATLFGTPDWVNERLRTVMDVTTDDVLRVTRRWLAPENRAVLTYRTDEAS